MFKALSFKKPKTPGYGISRGYYLTALAAKAPLPSVYELVNPKGDDGAIEGFGVPLCDTACKELLKSPMTRGSYAIATMDRKTVLRCLVVSKEEAGFDPEAFVRSAESMDADPELIARIRGVWTLVQLAFEAHDPMVAPALDFMIRFARAVSEKTDGAIADPISQRYFLPHELPIQESPDQIVAAAHVAVRRFADGPHESAFTLGMQKFGLAEYEINGLQESEGAVAEAFLLSLAQTELNGAIANVGDRLGAKASMFQVCEGGFDKRRWDGITCRELVPPRGKTVSDALSAWIAESR